MVTLKSDNLTDLWAQRLVKFFGWNTREQNKPLHKRTSKFYRPSMDGQPGTVEVEVDSAEKQEKEETIKVDDKKEESASDHIGIAKLESSDKLSDKVEEANPESK